jgi:hypothetical protein
MTNTVDKGVANVERENALESLEAGKGSIVPAPVSTVSAGGLTGKSLEKHGDEETHLAVEVVAEEESCLDGDGIPAELQGRPFQDIDALHDELDVLGLSDCNFLLNDDGFVTRPDPEHNRGTRFIRLKLNRYSKGWFGNWGFCDPDSVQQINRLTPSGRTAKREPDVNFWNYEKCVKSGGEMKVQTQAGNRFDLDPDLFFQFSWGNSEPKEFAAYE